MTYENEQNSAASDLDVIALGKDRRSQRRYKLVSIHDPDGEAVEVLVSNIDLAQGEGRLFAVLAEAGYMPPTTRARRHQVAAAFEAATPKRRIEVTAQVGWVELDDGSFVFCTPAGNYGRKRGHVRLDACRLRQDQHFGVAGTLEQWQCHVAQPARGNRLLITVLCLAFAAPLLRLCRGKNFGVQLFGPSSTGKTVAATVAGSVWGGGGPDGFAQTWSATENAIDTLAMAHGDSLLVLDESGLADAGDRQRPGAKIVRAIYRLASGAEKARATEAARGSWRCAFLSTSERSLATMAKEAGMPLHPGQAVRLIDIPADGGAGCGVFEVLHDAADADSFARNLEVSARTYYGSAAARFLTKLTRDAAVAVWVEARMAHYRRHAGSLVRRDSGRSARVGRHFALIYAAGRLAAKYGILPYSKGELLESVLYCHQQAVGTAEEAAEASGLALVANYIRTHQAQFLDLDALKQLSKEEWERAPGGIARSRYRTVYYFSNSVFRERACTGANPTSVVAELREAQLMRLSGDGKWGVLCSFPKPLGRARAICISSAILDRA